MNKILTIAVFFLFSGIVKCISQEQLNLNIESLEVAFIKVPKGTFKMGADTTSQFFQKDELPQTTIEITKDFYLGRTEVTQELWEKIMGYNPSVFRNANNPVEMVSWDDCKAFIEVLNNLWEGEGTFRLPTEAEWEYACRLGEPDYRNDQGELVEWQLLKYAWFYSRSEGKCHPVASKAADKMGFYDLQGSLWEWCEDWKGTYNGGFEKDPIGPVLGTHKIYRGGSWFNEPEALRPENRNAHEPHKVFSNAGLRLVYIAK